MSLNELDLQPKLDKFDQLGSHQHRSGVDLIVSISQQKLYLISASKLLCVYSVSTSKFGIGSEDGSLKTPLGMHRISERIGDGCAQGVVFKGRVETGQVIRVNQFDSSEDLITTRILRLEGLEPGINSGTGIDSLERYIYIHGTPHEALIGQPASHGCIRLTNHDVVDVFDRVEEGTLVLIEE